MIYLYFLKTAVNTKEAKKKVDYSTSRWLNLQEIFMILVNTSVDSCLHFSNAFSLHSFKGLSKFKQDLNGKVPQKQPWVDLQKWQKKLPDVRRSKYSDALSDWDLIFFSE